MMNTGLNLRAFRSTGDSQMVTGMVQAKVVVQVFGAYRVPSPLAPRPRAYRAYGLSFAPGQPRSGVEAIADCLAELMTDVLGIAASPRRAATGARSSPRAWATPTPSALSAFTSTSCR